MKIDAFLTCLGYYGMTTGGATSLEGAYALTSGTTGIFYNQLYSTGAHFVNGQIYAPTLPLINVYPNNLINNNILSGRNGLRVGYNHSGNFSLILDIEYSGCTRPFTQRGMVLVSTAASPSGFNTGFMVGITESNRLFFNTSGYTQTLDRELGVHNFVYVSLAEQKYVTMGIYDLNDDKLYKQSIALSSGILNSNDIYIGNFLASSVTDPYTGYSGKLNQVILFNDTLADSDVDICSNCSLVTGFNKTTSTYSFLASQLTGSFTSGVMDFAITGYTNVTGSVTAHDGSSISVVFPSGQTGFFQTGQVVIPMFSGITIQGTRDVYAFQYDTNAINSFSTFSVNFDIGLTSGDTIEIYSYGQPNTNIGKILNGINWPVETGTIQLIANGLNETLGVDYYISRNQISGYTTDDVLSYDVLVAPSVVTAYSGYWNDVSRIVMSGGGFYPSAPQYLEDTANFSGIVKITGISGVCINNPFYPNFGYDLHMNGQKLISGRYYDVVASGTSGFVVLLSGTKLPPLTVYPIYDITGGGPIGVSNVDDNELAFIPEFSGFQQTVIDVTSNGNVFANITGFGEQIWVNGIRQLSNLDYKKNMPCNFITGQYNPPVLDFVLYDSDAGNDALWNLATPPMAYISSVLGDGIDIFAVSVSLTTTNNVYPTNIPCIEIWTAFSVSSGVLGPFTYMGLFSNNSFNDFTYTGYESDPIGHVATLDVLARYRVRNFVGPFTGTGPIAVTLTS